MIELRASGLADVAIFSARPFPRTGLFYDCLSLYGENKLEYLLEYQYLEDYKKESNPKIKEKLHRYDAIPLFQINRYDKSVICECSRGVFT